MQFKMLHLGIVIMIIVLFAGASCNSNKAVKSTTGTTLISTTMAPINTTVYTAVTSTPMPNQGNIQITDGKTSRTFQYVELSTATPTSFKFLDVTFTLWIVATIAPGPQCFGPVNGGYSLTFADSSSEKVDTCVLVNPNNPIHVALTNHVSPQAGLLINTTTRAIYFLVSP